MTSDQMHQLAEWLDSGMKMLRELNEKKPDRNISIAITCLEDAAMRINRAYYQPGRKI